jgi:hypothetical protein
VQNHDVTFFVLPFFIAGQMLAVIVKFHSAYFETCSLIFIKVNLSPPLLTFLTPSCLRRGGGPLWGSGSRQTCEGFIVELLDRLGHFCAIVCCVAGWFRYVQFCLIAATEIVKNKIKDKNFSHK